MQVYEAIVKVQGSGGYEMGEPTINQDTTSVDDWFDAQRSMEYGTRNVTADFSGIVQLPHSVATDRGVTYAAVTFYPGDEPSVYAVWEA
jgi:hypothetical protein